MQGGPAVHATKNNFRCKMGGNSTPIYLAIFTLFPQDIVFAIQINQFRKYMLVKLKKLLKTVFLFIFSCSGNLALASHSTCANNTEDSFTLQVFRFAGQTTGSQVWIFVTAMVCVDDGGTTECETECAACGNSNRRRRNTLEESLKARYYLKYGPLKVADLEKEEKGLYLS